MDEKALFHKVNEIKNYVTSFISVAKGLKPFSEKIEMDATKMIHSVIEIDKAGEESMEKYFFRKIIIKF